jgi:hypothetical protein
MGRGKWCIRENRLVIGDARAGGEHVDGAGVYKRRDCGGQGLLC